MAREWSAGESYEVGEVVEFEGVKYKNIQAHVSQDDWKPPYVPALWGRMSEGEHRAHERGEYHRDEEVTDDGRKWHETREQTVEIKEEDRKKEWWDLDAKKKKEMEIGGGLAVGLGLLGAGVYAYEHHKKTQEQQKAELWALQNWITEARARTERYRNQGAIDTVTWVLVESKSEIPQDALIGGKDVNGEDLYVCRSYQAGGLHPGKCGSHLNKGALISYQKKTIEVDKFEVLIALQESVQWVNGAVPFSESSFTDVTIVEGGVESDRVSKYYIAQAPYQGALHCGKVRETYKGAYIAVEREEVVVQEYRVLALK